MAKIKIVTDTTADLTKELYEKLDCEVFTASRHHQ